MNIDKYSNILILWYNWKVLFGKCVLGHADPHRFSFVKPWKFWITKKCMLLYKVHPKWGRLIKYQWYTTKIFIYSKQNKLFAGLCGHSIPFKG